mmetsp:Transcript_21671/g.47249  ORF Transcript_21671/g.47249 Transcript_21671/m.47249 type:complete len:216 (+) Transcript_21671:43-690(+)
MVMAMVIAMLLSLLLLLLLQLRLRPPRKGNCRSGGSGGSLGTPSRRMNRSYRFPVISSVRTAATASNRCTIPTTTMTRMMPTTTMAMAMEMGSSPRSTLTIRTTMSRAPPEPREITPLPRSIRIGAELPSRMVIVPARRCLLHTMVTVTVESTSRSTHCMRCRDGWKGIPTLIPTLPRRFMIPSLGLTKICAPCRRLKHCTPEPRPVSCFCERRR